MHLEIRAISKTLGAQDAVIGPNLREVGIPRDL